MRCGATSASIPSFLNPHVLPIANTEIKVFDSINILKMADGSHPCRVLSPQMALSSACAGGPKRADSFWVVRCVTQPVNLMLMGSLLHLLCCEVV